MKFATGALSSSSARTSRRLASKRFALYATLGFLLVGSAFFGFIPKAHALTTLNPGNVPGSSGGGTQLTSQEKVFYANGYWWVFWGSLGGTNGIYYESSPDGKTWSTPTDFSNAQNPTNGGTAFDGYLVGNTLYYALAPKTSGANFWWGEATLGNTGTVTMLQTNIVHNLAAGRIGTSGFRVSILVDGNGYITIAVTTSNAAATLFYVDVFQCQAGAATCALGTSTWYTAEFLLATTLVADLTAPSLIPVSSAGVQYDALLYDDAASAGGAAGFGPFKVFIAASSAGSLPLSSMVPATPTCSPASQFYAATNTGATSITNTVYVADSYFGSGTYSFSCPVGGPVSAEDPISASSFIMSLGVSGTTLVAVYPSGANIQSYTSINGGASWAVGVDVAQNTETTNLGLGTPASVDISPVAYTIGSQTYMGVDWIDGNYVRFATLSLTNFPVTVNIGLSEYQIPQTAWYPLTPANEFQITYTQCTNAPLCTTTAGASVNYGSCSSLQGSCTTATPAYACATGATAGCYITIPNVESYTLVTVAAKSTGSTATEEWCLNIASASGACAATAIGASDGIPATVSVGGTSSPNGMSFVYYDMLANPTKYTVTPAAPAPPSTPTIHLITASSASLSTFSPATYNNNQAAGSTTDWIAKNSTDFASASIAGVSSDQWAANPNNLAWTVVSANQINPNIVYYHQYLNNFVINSGGAQQFDGTGQFVITGTQYGAVGALATLAPTGVATLSTDLWTDAATTVTFPAQATGTPSGERWESTTGAALVTAAISTGVGVNPSGYSDTYWEQWQQALAYSTNDGSTPPTVPAITYTSFGVVAAHNLNTTTNSDWLDAATTATVPATIAGGAGERWNTQVSSWANIKTQNAITNPSIEYYHQFTQQLKYSTSDNTVPTIVPAMTYQAFGVVKAHTLNTTVNTDWLDANTQGTVPATIAGGVGIQWSTPTTAWTISAENVVANPIVYTHQYLISFAVAPAGTGVVNPTGTNVWESATSIANGISPISIAATPIAGYSFTTWTASAPGITFAASASASTTATLNGPGTITANFQIVSGLSFVETGIALDGTHTWSVTLTAWPAAYSGLTTLSATTQAIVLASAPLGSYTYTVPSPQSWGAGTQYLVTAGASGTTILTVANPSSTDSVTFQGQFFLSLLQNPANSGTVTANGSPLNQWFTSGATVTLFAAPNVGITFSTWTGITCNPGCASATQNIQMTGPFTATANFIVPLSISICSPETAGVGTALNCTVTATGGSGTINLTNGVLPGGITVSYTSNGFAASASGASSSMIVTIAPNAPFGVYTWTVTATDEPNGLQATTTYQISVISPSVTTIGFTTSAYAITYGSQSALFFASGHWFVIYSDGTNLIYRSSTDATGTNWNAQVIISTGITQGYSFAVGNWQASGVSYVSLALMTSSYTGGFYYVQGTITGAVISWTGCAGQCALSPISMQKLSIAPGLTAEGSPSIFIDTSAVCSVSSPTGVCIWVTVPALDPKLMWHVEVAYLTNSWTIPASDTCVAQGDVCLQQVYTGPDSQVHSELYSMPDAVAAIFVVGNTPDLPHITVFNHLDTTAMTFCAIVSAACPLGAAMAGTWTGIKIYEQQSQGVVMPSAPGTDVIFFAALAQNGVAANGADVQFYSFTYNSAAPATSSFSAPTTLGITSIPQNAVVNHSWHLSMTFGGNSLYLAYGIDDSLAFEVGTVGSGPAYAITWSQQIQVPDVAGLVGGVTIAYSGNTVGLVWVQTSGSQYAVKFAVI